MEAETKSEIKTKTDTMLVTSFLPNKTKHGWGEAESRSRAEVKSTDSKRRPLIEYAGAL